MCTRWLLPLSFSCLVLSMLCTECVYCFLSKKKSCLLWHGKPKYRPFKYKVMWSHFLIKLHWITSYGSCVSESYKVAKHLNPVLNQWHSYSLCRRPHLHVVEDFEEGEGHAAANDHLIDLIQHVVDQLDLIFHLRSETQTEGERRNTSV